MNMVMKNLSILKNNSSFKGKIGTLRSKRLSNLAHQWCLRNSKKFLTVCKLQEGNNLTENLRSIFSPAIYLRSKVCNIKRLKTNLNQFINLMKMNMDMRIKIMSMINRFGIRKIIHLQISFKIPTIISLMSNLNHRLRTFTSLRRLQQ